ncbi:hypothetical protein FFLO_01870 [Filobasidium floriforme]|uniref:Arginyl-tRNA--protein transferase 1 n=1 Tax=Filobasidium floriforme TaxID=5210 RepID=A0A8K0JNS5_9TREE|nr:arginine-tRNA-protein transferase [Filobasidium floriforme]KAG7562710.1 hypothetical protein FFLO_01870 [Filobasidium floriforme]KAH8086816.1 arginine-tRNA-protein transferase [Filobasidium floriforme]
MSSEADVQGDESREIPTLLEPAGYGSSSCGYCSPPGERSSSSTSKSYGMIAPQMSPRVYQQLIDRGWRRSGDYVYHPDNANTCCPQLTIRLDAMAFKPEKDRKLRQILNRWKRFVMEGNEKEKETEEKVGLPRSTVGATRAFGGEDGKKGREKIEIDEPKEADPTTSASGPTENSSQKRIREYPDLTSGPTIEGRKRQKGNQKPNNQNNKNKNKPFDFPEELHAPEWINGGPAAAHQFEIRLVKAEATPETFALYDKYQQAVHGDKPGKNTMSSFKRFLCKNPLGWQKMKYPEGQDVPAHLPTHYGGYHQLWMVDDKLVAFSVIDILPGCVSSVYFVWDPDYAWASLGKLSALREAALAREMQQAGIDGAGWLYMGFYIHSCQKMRYKGEYSPSQLLDPGTNTWHALENVKGLLDSHPTGYHPFDGSVNEAYVSRNSSTTSSVGTKGSDAWPKPPPPGFREPQTVSKETLRNLAVFLGDQLVLLKSRRSERT